MIGRGRVQAILVCVESVAALDFDSYVIIGRDVNFWVSRVECERQNNVTITAINTGAKRSL